VLLGNEGIAETCVKWSSSCGWQLKPFALSSGSLSIISVCRVLHVANVSLSVSVDFVIIVWFSMVTVILLVSVFCSFTVHWLSLSLSFRVTAECTLQPFSRLAPETFKTFRLLPLLRFKTLGKYNPDGVKKLNIIISSVVLSLRSRSHVCTLVGIWNCLRSFFKCFECNVVQSPHSCQAVQCRRTLYVFTLVFVSKFLYSANNLVLVKKCCSCINIW